MDKLDSAEKANITNIIGYGCVRIDVYIYIYLCVCACVYIYVCVRACVCVCVCDIWRNTSKSKMGFI